MGIIDEILKLAADKVLVESHVSEEIAGWRMSVCKNCDKFSLPDLRCKICRCFLEVKTFSRTNRSPKQMRNEITHCPLGKWGDLETANEYRKLDGLVPITET